MPHPKKHMVSISDAPQVPRTNLARGSRINQNINIEHSSTHSSSHLSVDSSHLGGQDIQTGDPLIGTALGTAASGGCRESAVLPLGHGWPPTQHEGRCIRWIHLGPTDLRGPEGGVAQHPKQSEFGAGFSTSKRNPAGSLFAQFRRQLTKSYP